MFGTGSSNWGRSGNTIFCSAENVGIGLNNPETRFTIKNNHSDENSGLFLDAGMVVRIILSFFHM